MLCIQGHFLLHKRDKHSFILLLSCTEAVFSLLYMPILHYLDYHKFFLEQHVHILCICDETNNLRCITVNCRVLIFIVQQNMRMSICGVFIDFLFTGWKQTEAVWILKQHPVSLLILSNSLFSSGAVKHQQLNKLPIVQLPWTIGWCNLANKTNLHSAHLTERYFSSGDTGPFTPSTYYIFKQQNSNSNSKHN